MQIELSSDEALILSDLLCRISQNRKIFPDIAVRQVLWCIEAQLDKTLLEIFDPNYKKLVEEAKDRIRWIEEEEE